jgi:hypothetical protein
MSSVLQCSGRPVLHYTASIILAYNNAFSTFRRFAGGLVQQTQRKMSEKAKKRNNRWHATDTEILDPNFWLLYSVVQ